MVGAGPCELKGAPMSHATNYAGLLVLFLHLNFSTLVRTLAVNTQLLQ